MNFKQIPPVHELKDVVSHFWVASWNENVQHLPSTYFATANSQVELVFAFKSGYKNTELAFSSIQGLTASHGQYPAGRFYNLIGVSLYAHAIPLLFNTPLTQINDRHVAFDELLGIEGQNIEDKIDSADSTKERINILSEYFKTKISNHSGHNKQMAKIIQVINQNCGNINIDKLSENFFYSHKQFNRKFKAFTGFNPKLFARMVRFESILKSRSHYPNLTNAALSHGFYDQAHFIREFKTFSGFSPNQFFKLSGY